MNSSVKWGGTERGSHTSNVTQHMNPGLPPRQAQGTPTQRLRVLNPGSLEPGTPQSSRRRDYSGVGGAVRTEPFRMGHVNKQMRTEKQEELNVLEERLAWASRQRGRAKACPGETANKETNRQTDPNLDQQSPSEMLVDGLKPVRAPKEEGTQKSPEMVPKGTNVNPREWPREWWRQRQGGKSNYGKPAFFF